MVSSLQKQLTGESQRTFTNVLDPRLVAILQEQLQPVKSKLQDDYLKVIEQNDDLVSKIEQQHQNIQLIQQELLENSRCAAQNNEMLMSGLHEQDRHRTSAVETIKQHITSAIEALKTEQVLDLWEGRLDRREMTEDRRLNLSQSLSLMRTIPVDNERTRESLRDLWVLTLHSFHQADSPNTDII
jgi:hypothetical protein